MTNPKSTDPYGQFYDKYLGMGNNPVNGIDPDGGFFISQADGGKSWVSVRRSRSRL